MSRPLGLLELQAEVVEAEALAPRLSLPQELLTSYLSSSSQLDPVIPIRECV
jgi:hypothetical protein